MNRFWTIAGYCLLALIVGGVFLRWILVTYIVAKAVDIEEDKAKAGITPPTPK